MIVLTKLNGPSFALNPDLIERVDADPGTVVVLIGGASYPIAESVDELLDCVFRLSQVFLKMLWMR